MYRANDIGSVGQALHPDISEDFWLFLDITKATMGTTNSEEIAHTGKAISASVEAYILKLRHRILTVRKAVELMKSQILNEIEFQNQRITSHLLEQQSRFDADVLQLVLQYYAIIQHEIATSRTKLLQENSEKDLLCKQAAILRDIRLFAYHLMVESRGKLGFTLLSPESQQFVRCVKAVMDNINNGVFQMANADALRTQIKVLNVFKLQNSFLSGKLQVRVDCARAVYCNIACLLLRYAHKILDTYCAGCVRESDERQDKRSLLLPTPGAVLQLFGLRVIRPIPTIQGKS